MASQAKPYNEKEFSLLLLLLLPSYRFCIGRRRERKKNKIILRNRLTFFRRVCWAAKCFRSPYHCWRLMTFCWKFFDRICGYSRLFILISQRPGEPIQMKPNVSAEHQWKQNTRKWKRRFYCLFACTQQSIRLCFSLFIAIRSSALSLSSNGRRFYSIGMRRKNCTWSACIALRCLNVTGALLREKCRFGCTQLIVALTAVTTEWWFAVLFCGDTQYVNIYHTHTHRG